ncbi:MAG: hypothetical protein Q8Q05_00075 [bacterium]|nr:hypothetical protein [bacterium]
MSEIEPTLQPETENDRPMNFDDVERKFQESLKEAQELDKPETEKSDTN